MERYKGKEYMKHKKHVHELGATAATCLSLTESLADSWFRSVKSAV